MSILRPSGGTLQAVVLLAPFLHCSTPSRHAEEFDMPLGMLFMSSRKGIEMQLLQILKH